MSSKGLTLTEILGVIVIIGILLILIILGIINRLSNSGKEATETENQLIFDATDQYIKEHPSDFPPGKSGRYCIAIQSLVDDGKLVAPVTDVNTGEDITNKSVMVTIYSTGNTDHEIREGDECKEIASLPMIDFVVEPSGSSWVKQRKVTIIYPKIDGKYEASHRIDGGSWTRDSSADDGGNIELTFTKIGKLEARLKGSNIISSRINIVNVDSEVPVIKDISVPSGWSNKNKTATATVYDGISGVKSYYLSDSNNAPTEDNSGWVDVNYDSGEKTIDLTNLAEGTYYLWVKDKSGNISASNNNAFTVDKIDEISPTCNITISGNMGNNNWYNSNVSLKLNYNDEGGSDVAEYGITTSETTSYNGKDTATQTNDTEGIVYYGYVKDTAGNTYTCQSAKFKKDATKPTLSYTLKKADGGVYNNGALSDKDVIRTLIPKDNLSDIDHTEYKDSSGWHVEGNVASYTYTSSNNANFRTIDKAGNVSDEINLNIQIQKDPDINMRATCGRVCGPYGYKCYVDGYNAGASWRWDFSGANSGINPWSMQIDYSTEYVAHWLIMNYPQNQKNGGRAEWGSNWILFGRAYARQSIVGTACSNTSKCTSCTVTS